LKLSSLIEKRNALMTQISTLAKTDSLNTEQRSQFDAMAADLEALNADVQRAERAEAIEHELRSASRPPRANPGEQRENANNEAEVRAFSDFIKFGTRSNELRSGIGSGPVAGNVSVSGSVFIPSAVGDLTIVKKTFGNLASAVRNVVTDSGDAMSFPVIDDTAQNDLYEINELTDATQAPPTLTGVNSTVDLLTTKSIVVSNSLLQDSAFDVQQWVNEVLTTRVTNGLAKRLYAGNSGSFTAITANAPTAVTTASGTAISWNELCSAYGSIDAAYRANASWVLSSLTHAYLMGITNPSTGQPILQPDVHGNPFMSLLGRPVVIAENAASIALGSTPILFGDLSTVILRSVRNASIIRQNELYSNQNATGFILFYRAGSVITSQASSPAIKSLKMKAS
jgi:HK97 family phage major capsid protein